MIVTSIAWDCPLTKMWMCRLASDPSQADMNSCFRKEFEWQESSIHLSWFLRLYRKSKPTCHKSTLAADQGYVDMHSDPIAYLQKMYFFRLSKVKLFSAYLGVQYFPNKCYIRRNIEQILSTHIHVWCRFKQLHASICSQCRPCKTFISAS